MNKQTVLRNSVAATITAAAITAGGIGLASADDTETPDTSQERRVDGLGGFGPGGHGPGGLPGFGASADLAAALGVSEDELTDAFKAIREDVMPPKPTEGEDGERTRPSEADREERQAAIAKALAAELDLSEADVAAALDEVREAGRAERRTALSERLDTAVDDADLTEADKSSVLKAYDAGVLGGPGK